ncbi:hypothetical protein [Paraburkholderia youngii]|uniref:hypothetical protein n=1 Tax=Paraburkholderia youngii TaxID=2782701 RepID=UPI001594BDF5|nr:hypothetical protein [Paraburkholderia youngii]
MEEHIGEPLVRWKLTERGLALLNTPFLRFLRLQTPYIARLILGQLQGWGLWAAGEDHHSAVASIWAGPSQASTARSDASVFFKKVKVKDEVFPSIAYSTQHQEFRGER